MLSQITNVRNAKVVFGVLLKLILFKFSVHCAFILSFRVIWLSVFLDTSSTLVDAPRRSDPLPTSIKSTFLDGYSPFLNASSTRPWRHPCRQFLLACACFQCSISKHLHTFKEPFNTIKHMETHRTQFAYVLANLAWNRCPRL